MRKIREIYTSTFWDAILQTGTCALSEEVMTRRECLKKYEDKYWYSENKERWVFYLPDETRKEGRKQVSRKRRKDIEDIVYKHYYEEERRTEKQKKAEAIEHMTVRELFFEYMEHKKKQVKARTISRMMVDWEKFYESDKTFIEKPFKEINSVDVDDFLNNTIEKYVMTKKCFNNFRGILKQIFVYAVDMGYIEKSPYRTSNINRKNILPNRKKDNITEIFMPEERTEVRKELYRKAEKKELYLVPWVILLAFETGARIGELLALRESDIHNGDELHIQRQLTKEENVESLNDIKTKGWVISDYTKTISGDRKIPLTDEALRCLRRIKEINQHTGEQYEDYLFYRPNDVITVTRVNSLLYRVCKNVNIPPRSSHKIRKTYASILYSEGMTPLNISKLLGHVDETIVFKHYIYPIENTEKRDDQVREALQKDLKENTEKNEVSESTKINQKIIPFPTGEKTQKPRKIKHGSIPKFV